MKKITLVLALLLMSITSYAQQGPFLYQVEENWLAECDTATPLTTEDFENSTASGGVSCGTILSSDVATDCFPVGELEDGFEITASDGGLTFYGAPGQLGANQDAPVVGVVGGIAQSTVVTFTTPVTRVALDVFGISNSLGNGVIRVFDTDNNLLQTFDIDVTIGEFKFFGIHSSTLIGNVELEDPDNGDGLIFGNFRFGQCQLNDDPDTAIALTVGDVFEDAPLTQNNNFASDSQLVNPALPAPGCASYNGGDVWFSAVVPASGSITLEIQDVDGSALTDSGMAVYTEDLTAVLDCDDDDGEGFFSLIELTALTPGETIFIRVWEFGGNAFGEFTVSAYDDFSPPPNDLIENAIDVDELGFPYTDSDVNFPDATNDQITNTSGCNATTQNSVWYKFTTTGEGTITASFEDPTNNDNKAIIFYSAANENATLDDLTFVNSGTNTCGFNIELSFEANANQTYYAFAQASTTVQTINIDFTPAPPPNDLIENAIDVDELGFPYTDSDVNFPDATNDQITNTSGCNATTQNSVWYKFTTTGEGTITASFEDPTNNDNKAIIFYSAANENATLDDLTFVNSGTNTCGFNLEVSFEADANQTYYAFAQASTTVQTIIIESDAVLSTEENTIEGFSFFPNPVVDVLTINAGQSIDQITMFNIAGQKVLDKNINATNTQLSVGDLPSGIYLMTATSGTTTSTYKVIKK